MIDILKFIMKVIATFIWIPTLVLSLVISFIFWDDFAFGAVAGLLDGIWE